MTALNNSQDMNWFFECSVFTPYPCHPIIVSAVISFSHSQYPCSCNRNIQTPNVPCSIEVPPRSFVVRFPYFFTHVHLDHLHSRKKSNIRGQRIGQVPTVLPRDLPRRATCSKRQIVRFDKGQCEQQGKRYLSVPYRTTYLWMMILINTILWL